MIAAIYKKLKSFWHLFIIAPKEWQLPKKRELLLYDSYELETFRPYLSRHNFGVLPTNGESINVPCLIRAALTKHFWQGNFFGSYALAYINAISPKVVLTFIDNNPSFYLLSKKIPTIKTLFLQNGTRAEAGDIFDVLNPLSDYHVDFMFVHNEAIGRLYKKYVSGEVIVSGSFKNNCVRVSNNASDGIVFISQWRPRPKNGETFYKGPDGTVIHWEEFYAAEIRVLEFLDKWCTERDEVLKICCWSNTLDSTQQDFYATYLKSCRWQHVRRVNSLDSYALVDKANIVVFIESTLGYEAIGRGKRTASFSCRLNEGHRYKFRFGWPASLPDNGPFWTNYQDEAQFLRVMNYVYTVSDQEWERTREPYARELMEFDLENAQFKVLLETLLTNKPCNEDVC